MEDVGVEVASIATGVVPLAQRLEKNAERDCRRLFVNQFGLSLPIPISRLEIPGKKVSELEVPYLRLRDWAQFLLDCNHTHILTGLNTILTAFWKNFEVQHPSHPVFARARNGDLDLSSCCPMVLHGDEGRGRKRTAFLVMNFHSLLGFGLQEGKKKHKRPHLRARMQPNYAGSSLTTRFLLASLPKHMYTGDNEEVFQSLLNVAAQEAENMFYAGVSSKSGRRLTMALLYIGGDWPWLADSGGMLRSFRNCQKRKNQKKEPVGICHLCAAGQIGYDFEQINTKSPDWLDTMFSQSPFADGDEGSFFHRVPHVPEQLSGLWAYDVFHTWHLGIARCFLGSFLALLSDLEPEGSIDDRFCSMSKVYLDWCKAHKKRPHVTKITKEHLQWLTRTSYPSGGWHKGALSTTLMEFVEHRFRKEGGTWPAMLVLAGETAISGNNFLKLLYSSDAWLPPERASKVANIGYDFLQGYATLANMAFRANQTLWVLQPKLHCFHHICHDLWHSSAKGWVLNPLCQSTQQDEDFVGRPSRLSRRVTAQKPCALRVTQRYLQLSYAEFVKAKFILPSKHKRGS